MCFLSLSPCLTLAQSDIQLISTDNAIRLSPQLKVFKEPDIELSVFQALAYKDAFVWQSAGSSNYGYSQQGIWLHTSISNVTENRDWVIDIASSQLEKADFYVLFKGKIIGQSKQGKTVAKHQYRLPTLHVALPYAQTVELRILNLGYPHRLIFKR